MALAWAQQAGQWVSAGLHGTAFGCSGRGRYLPCEKGIMCGVGLSSDLISRHHFLKAAQLDHVCQSLGFSLAAKQPTASLGCLQRELLRKTEVWRAPSWGTVTVNHPLLAC